MVTYLRGIFILLCALCGLGGSGPSIAELPRAQFLVPDSLPTVARGESTSISFTATKSISSIVKHVTFYAPDGLIITGIGPGKSGNMPQCQVTNPLPSNYVTCVAKLQGDAYFTFAPMHSIAVNLAVDASANTGTLSGVAQIEQRDDGVHDASFAVNAQPTVELNDAVRNPSQPVTRNLLWLAVSTFVSVFTAAFFGWHAHTIPLDQLLLKFPTTIVTRAVYAPGTPGTASNRYSAIGKVSAYHVISNADGTSSIAQSNCSGVVVPSKGKNILMTAAHCLVHVDPATNVASWYTRLAFCPGISQDKKTASPTIDNPLACPDDQIYTAVIDPLKRVPKAYVNGVWANILTSKPNGVSMAVAQYDLAFVELKPNTVSRRNVEEVHGANGIIFNVGAISRLGTQTKSVGYNGNSWDINLCNRGPLMKAGNIPGLPLIAYTLIGKDFKGCNMSQGVSGGPWIMNDAKTTNLPNTPSGLVFGVNSVGAVPNTLQSNPFFMWTTIATGSIDVQYTPIFRDWAVELYKAASDIQPVSYAF